MALDQNEDSVDSVPVENFYPPDCNDSAEPDACDEYFGEPDILPRVGDEFQVELPPLSPELNPKNANYRADYQQNMFIGLPIPVTWISQKHDILSKNAIKTETYCNDEKFRDNIKPSNEPHNLLVPGICYEHWSDAEKASFLLGLYIFQKNFVEVRSFVETKRMDEILSFYYGEFYSSAEYHRWCECRKKKSKKCVYGQRIFSGLRQQELLSRILSSVSEDRRGALLEVSKKFSDERISLADYVSSLKTMVGINKLVEAVGIGTGKRDLTGMAIEPSRSNQSIRLRPEVPTGKACSSLTTSEIVKLLSGDYRLSKARSQDLFWEAVWPRLLERGWRSEEPKDQSYAAGFKNWLVFLAPGVKKFSRRKLVKGEDYFDSVSDVLSRVAKEPGLIEIDNQQNDGEEKREECILTTEKYSGQGGDNTDGYKDDDDLSSRQRHCYLQPRSINQNAGAVEFTIIDTSLSGGRIRELRGLPVEILNSSAPQIRIENRYKNASEEITDESETGKFCPDINDISIRKLNSKEEFHVKKQLKKVSKSLPRQKVKRGSTDFIAPITKRGRRLTAGKREETNLGTSQSWLTSRLENGMSSCCSSNHGVTENSSPTSSKKGSPEESAECAPYSNIHTLESSRGTESRPLIDLNVPQVSPELENVTSELNEHSLPSSSAVEAGSEQQDADHNLPNSSGTEARLEQQPIQNSRRQSTRNRPPTTRALEALANGYLTVNRRRKSKDGNSHDEKASRPSQRARVVAGPVESTHTMVASQTEEVKNDASNSGECNLEGNSEVKQEAKEESVSGHGLGDTSS